MRFLSFLSFFLLFQFSSVFAETTTGVNLKWSCDKENRGELPKEKDIVAYYDQQGLLKFKPDVFKMPFRPFEIFKQRGTSDIADCLKKFTAQIPNALSFYKLSCDGRPEKLCIQSDEAISADLKMSIRGSKFYSKYQSSLASAEEDLGPKSVSTLSAAEVKVPLIKKLEQGFTDLVAPKKSQPDAPSNPVSLVPTTVGKPPENPVAPKDTIQPFNPEPNRSTNVVALIPATSVDVENEKRDIQSFIVNHPEFGKYTDFLWKCTGETGAPNVGGPYCKPLQINYDRLLNKLSELVNRLPAGVLRKPVTDDKISNTIQCLLPRDQSNKTPGIEDFLRVVNQPDVCEDLNNSESKLMTFDDHSYFLKRKENGDYEAILNINFDFQSGSQSSDGMLQKVRACMNSNTPFMLGPDHKSHLQISIKTPQEIESELPIGLRPETKTIHVVRKNFFDGTGIAGNTENFKEDFDCPGITHEFFHHLGMADEYPDRRTQIDPNTGKAWKDLYSCRIIPKYPSIMNDTWNAYAKGTRSKKVCECKSEGCSNLMNATDTDSANLRGIMNSPLAPDLFGYDNLKFCKTTALPLTNVLRNPSKAYDILGQSEGNLTLEFRSVVFIGKKALYNRAKLDCHCPAGDTTCAQAFSKVVEQNLQNSQASNCPAYTELVPNIDPASLPESSGPYNGKLLIVKEPSLPSLMAPNQFGKVLFGNCPTGPASEYDYCDKYAREQIGNPVCNTKRPEATGNQCLGVQ